MPERHGNARYTKKGEDMLLNRHNPANRKTGVTTPKFEANEQNSLVFYDTQDSTPGSNRALVFAVVFVPLMALAVLCACVVAVVAHLVTPAKASHE